MVIIPALKTLRQKYQKFKVKSIYTAGLRTHLRQGDHDFKDSLDYITKLKKAVGVCSNVDITVFQGGLSENE